MPTHFFPIIRPPPPPHHTVAKPQVASAHLASNCKRDHSRPHASAFVSCTVDVVAHLPPPPPSFGATVLVMRANKG